MGWIQKTFLSLGNFLFPQKPPKQEYFIDYFFEGKLPEYNPEHTRQWIDVHLRDYQQWWKVAAHFLYEEYGIEILRAKLGGRNYVRLKVQDAKSLRTKKQTKALVYRYFKDKTYTKRQ